MSKFIDQSLKASHSPPKGRLDISRKRLYNNNNDAGWSSGSSLGSTRRINKTNMSTKLRGDIAEQAAILHALKHGWGVLRPVGDRLPYDLVLDVEGTLVKVQVKCAWFDDVRGNYVVDNRRTKTNRRMMIRDTYKPTDFDFALVYIEQLDLFYIFPVDVFTGYASEIHMVEAGKRQRKPSSANYRNAWDLVLQWAACRETGMRSPVKFGEAVRGVTPSQAPMASATREGVET